MSATTEWAVKQLVQQVPALQVVLDEHIGDNNVLLPHVFFGDVSRFLVRRCSEPGDVDAQSDERSDDIKEVLHTLERQWAAGPEEVRELIQVSLIENLPEFGECEEVIALLGPSLRAVYDELNA